MPKPARGSAFEAQPPPCMSYLGALSVPGPIGVQGMAVRSGGPTRSSQDGYDESYSLLMELVSQA